MELNRIVHDSNSQDRDKIAAAIAISDRGCGKPAIGVFHGGALPMEQTEDGSPVFALLRAARGNSDERALAELYAEARRVEAKLAQDKQDFRWSRSHERCRDCSASAPSRSDA